MSVLRLENAMFTSLIPYLCTIVRELPAALAACLLMEGVKRLLR